MSETLKAAAEGVLAGYVEPYLQTDLITAETVRKLEVNGDSLHLELDLGFPCGGYGQQLADNLRGRLLALDGISDANVTVGFTVAEYAVQPLVQRIPEVRNIIAVASAKGGVGKSTVAANLALALSADGANVGMLDADIYGPSQPQILGVSDRATAAGEKSIRPNIGHGMQTMSIGYLIDVDSPAILRGPMVTSALQQMLFQTAWSDLDYLVIDLPPGTGDIQLTLSQKIPVSGAVIVTTPQDLSLLDARKGLEMFEKVNVKTLGIVENMSTHVCSNCGHEEAIFGEGGGRKLAEQYGVALLGQLPLNMSIRKLADSGTPTVVSEPDSDIAAKYFDMARATAARLSRQRKEQKDSAPSIKIQDD